MALDTNDLLVVSKSSDGSLAKVKVETLLAGADYIEEAPVDGKQYVRKDGAWVESNSSVAGDLAFVFMSNYVIEKDSSESVVAANGVFIGRQPTNIAYQWVEWNTFSGSFASATDIPLQFNRQIDGTDPTGTNDRVNCRVTVTYADSSTEILYSGAAVEVFTPIGDGGFPTP